MTRCRVAVSLLGSVLLLALLDCSSVSAHEYIGCYKDVYSSSDRDLVGSLILNVNHADLISPDYCEDYCGPKHFKYYGVQFGTECWCGNSYGKHGKLDESKCDSECVGDKSLKNACGGALSNSVYKVTKTYAASNNPNDGRPLLGLVMIVKNEAHTLPNTLKSLAPFIDTYYILDTGSTDGTQAAIKRTLGDKGEVWEEPFIDYGRSRNRALDIAQKAKNPPIFSLMLSADETVHNPEALRAFCEEFRDADGAMHEAYPITMDVGWKFDSVRLSRTDKGWRYVGRVHEYLAAPDQKWRPALRVPKAWIKFEVTDPERRGQREYKIRDILLEEVREKPTDTRASFYLARTYNVIGNHSAALVEFKRRIALGGWQEEVYESFYAIAFQLEAMGKPWSEVQQAFLDAHNHSPERGEPLHNIAQHHWNHGNRNLVYLFASLCAGLPYPKDAVLWVQAEVYAWRCLKYQALTGFATKHTYDGYLALLKALKTAPEHEKQDLHQMRGQYENALLPIEKLKAECLSETKVGGECATLAPQPCIPAAGGSEKSVSSRIASSQPAFGEQSNVFLNAETDLNSQHIPASLRDKYTRGVSLAAQSRYAILFGFLAGMIFLVLAVVVVRQFRMCNSMYLKIFGGKKASEAYRDAEHHA